eukprot:COSAG05_NODE_2371_length_3162_cov_2.346066_1_plen_426_part_00
MGAGILALVMGAGFFETLKWVLLLGGCLAALYVMCNLPGSGKFVPENATAFDNCRPYNGSPLHLAVGSRSRFGREVTVWIAERPGRPHASASPLPAVTDAQVDKWCRFMKRQGVGRVVCLLGVKHLKLYAGLAAGGLAEAYRARDLQADHVSFEREIPLREHLTAATLALLDAERSEQTVVLHCSGGCGRSSAVALAWLCVRAGGGITANLERLRKHALAFRVSRNPLEVGKEELFDAIAAMELDSTLQHEVAGLEGETVAAGALPASKGLFESSSSSTTGAAKAAVAKRARGHKDPKQGDRSDAVSADGTALNDPQPEETPAATPDHGVTADAKFYERFGEADGEDTYASEPKLSPRSMSKLSQQMIADAMVAEGLTIEQILGGQSLEDALAEPSKTIRGLRQRSMAQRSGEAGGKGGDMMAVE